MQYSNIMWMNWYNESNGYSVRKICTIKNVVLFRCCSVCLSRRKFITSDCLSCLFSDLSSTSLASLHFNMAAAIMVTLMPAVDMVTHTPALDMVILMSMHLTITVMGILMQLTRVLVTDIPTTVIPIGRLLLIKCLSLCDLSVRPPVISFVGPQKRFFDMNKIWCIDRGWWVIHDGEWVSEWVRVFNRHIRTK